MRNRRVLERLNFCSILLAPLQEKMEKHSRYLRSIICCRVRRSKPGGFGLAGVDMDMLLPGTNENAYENNRINIRDYHQRHFPNSENCCEQRS